MASTKGLLSAYRSMLRLAHGIRDSSQRNQALDSIRSSWRTGSVEDIPCIPSKLSYLKMVSSRRETGQGGRFIFENGKVIESSTSSSSLGRVPVKGAETITADQFAKHQSLVAKQNKLGMY